MLIKRHSPRNRVPYKIKRDLVTSKMGRHYLVQSIVFDLLSFPFHVRYNEKLISGRTEVYLLQSRDDLGSFIHVECQGKKVIAKWVFKPVNHEEAVRLCEHDVLVPCDEFFETP